MPPPFHTNTPRHLVLVGGGHAQVSVLKDLAEKPIQGLKITLISRDILTPYSGMLPGFMEGIYRAEEIVIDLNYLAERAGAELIQGTVEAIDPDARTVTVRGGESIDYDALSLNIGSNTDLTAIKGAAEYAIPIKPISTLLPRIEPFLSTPKRGKIAIIGGGAAGVEVACSLRHRLPSTPIALVHRGARLVAEYPDHAAKYLLGVLHAKNIETHLGCGVEAIESDHLILADGGGHGGGRIDADVFLVITAGVPPIWLGASGLALDDRGFIAVRPTLQAEGYDSVFASGDIAALTHAPRPKAGVFAVRAGAVLSANIRRYLLGEALVDWQPQAQYLALIGTGGRKAYAVRGKWGANLGRLGWWWKEYIDRKFMNKFSPR